MSRVEIDFPDCGEITADDTGQNITVHTEGSCLVHDGPPPLVPWWGFVLGAIVALAFIIGATIVRVEAHGRKRAIREAELEAQVEMAKTQKTCTVCGHDPRLAKK
jgi:hypothetical protein